MKLNLVLLIVGVHFITLTRQKSEYGIINFSVKKKCNSQHMNVRSKLMEYFEKLNELCGSISTTSTTTIIPTIPTTSTTTTSTSTSTSTTSTSTTSTSTTSTSTTSTSTTSTSTTTTTTSTTTTTTTTTTPCGVPATSLGPLFQLYSAQRRDHFYTNSTVEMARVIALGFMPQMSPGRITIQQQSCTCPGPTLVPIYRMYSATRNDHLYTANMAEVTSSMTAAGGSYVLQGIEWYCSPTPGYCGATVPLYRCYSTANQDTVLTANLPDCTGLVYMGVICNIWP